jgi:hypothetical protein
MASHIDGLERILFQYRADALNRERRMLSIERGGIIRLSGKATLAGYDLLTEQMQVRRTVLMSSLLTYTSPSGDIAMA